MIKELAIGDKFGRLTVLSNEAYGYARCRCECGTEKIIMRTKLRIGHTRSCGCLHRETLPNYNRTHGGFGTVLYRLWQGMITRCTNPNEPSFKCYGGRGIRVCDKWLHDFAAFRTDVGERPSAAYSLDRIDNDGNYEPGNVRWATKSQQMRNNRNTLKIEHGGACMSAVEWSERTGIAAQSIRQRLRRGWNVERTLTTPDRVQAEAAQ